MKNNLNVKGTETAVVGGAIFKSLFYNACKGKTSRR